jgi:hypothetical protein
MAVTISEMHVEVKDAAPAASGAAPSASADPKKDVNLRQALEILQIRNKRLRAD